MKKILINSIFLILLTLTLGIGVVEAHPILPQEITDFLRTNPEVSDEEFDNFVRESFGQEFLDKYYSITPEEPSEELTKYIENAKLIRSVTEEKSFFENTKDFISLGFEHIINGFDHVLFVLSLVLVLLPWKKILSMVTTFTVAHSITLILAGTGILTLSSRIVEPIIALSIAYVAITTVFLKRIPFFGKTNNKLLVVFVFGLFHGLGFAGVFNDLSIPPQQFLVSLLSFNVGVEFGQIAILILAVPFLELLSKKEKIYNIFTKVFAIAISLLAIIWFVERIL
jgi:hypothetical protein